MRFLVVFFIYLLSTATCLSGQTKTIERLKSEIEKAQNPDKKLQALFAFADQRLSLSADTLCKYAFAAKELSLTQNDIIKKALAEYYVATCLVKQGLLDTAFKISEAAILKIVNQNNNAEALMKLTGIKAQILIRSTKYKEGIAEVYKVLRIAEQSKDTVMQMIAKNAIGWANMEMDETTEALKWFYRALQTSGNKIHHEKNSNIYSNIAAVYKQLNKNDSAVPYIQKAIAFSRKSENLFFLANSLNILADIYIDTKRAALAETPLNEALAMRKEIGDPFYIVSDMSQLAIYYAGISQPAKGITLSLQGIEIAKKFNLSSKLPYLYHALGQNYKAAGNYAAYSKTLEKIMILKDSVNLINTAEAKAEMDTRYELDKHENLIRLQKKDITEKRSLFYGSLLFLFFTLLMSWLLFRGYKKTQQIKLLTMQSKEKQMTARAVISAEENERKRISRDLHDNIGAYATVLMANTEQFKKHAFGHDVQQSAEKISENARNIIGSLQETIWVLNNDANSLTDFYDRFKLYAKKVLQNFPEIEIRYNEQLNNDITLSPEEALNIFRIMQEALQNALKHAKPQHITVSVSADKAVYISLKDDGKGFSIDNAQSGHGLFNMKLRAKEAGYTLNINSGENGTEVALQKI